MNCPNRQTAAVGAGGRGCNPWGQGPAFERPVQFQGLGVALESQRDPVGSGSSSVCASGEGRYDSPEPQVRVTPHCPPAAAEPGGAGRGHLRALTVPKAPLRVRGRLQRCPPAPASPPPRSGDAQAPAHLRGSAPPPARFPRGPWRFRTCESGRSAAQKMDAGGWARTPRSATGAVQARRSLDLGRPPTRRLQGRCGPRSFSTARATAAEPGSHRAAQPQSRPCTQRGPRTFEPYAVLRASSSQD